MSARTPSAKGLPPAGQPVAGLFPDKATEVFLSRSVEETMAWGKTLGARISPPLAILLTGSLGTGKTTLVKGLTSGMGVEEQEEVNSPSYTLMNMYQGRFRIYHLDLYRLSSDRDLDNIGLFDLLEDGSGVVLIEWGELASPWISHGWRIHIDDLGKDERRLTLQFF